MENYIIVKPENPKKYKMVNSVLEIPTYLIEKNKNSIWIHRELKPGEIVYYHYEDIFHFEDKLFLSKVYKAGTIDEAFQAIHNF